MCKRERERYDAFIPYLKTRDLAGMNPAHPPPRSPNVEPVTMMAEGLGPVPEEERHSNAVLKKCSCRYRNTSLIRKRQPPWGHHRAVGIGLL